MAVEGCGKVMKYMVFCFNLIFWIVGMSILGIGIYVRVTKGDYATITDSIPFASVANLLIAVGAIVTVVGFVGCVGAWKENKCLLMTFFILLLIIFMLEMAAGILGYIYKGKVGDNIEDDLKSTLPKYGVNGEQGITNSWDRVQNQEECCGVYNYTDWYNAQSDWNRARLPDSCCRIHEKNCGMDVTNLAEFWTLGCKEQIQKSVEDNLFLIGGVGIAVAVIQLLGMIFSLALFCEVRKGDQYV